MGLPETETKKPELKDQWVTMVQKAARKLTPSEVKMMMELSDNIILRAIACQDPEGFVAELPGLFPYDGIAQDTSLSDLSDLPEICLALLEVISVNKPKDSGHVVSYTRGKLIRLKIVP
jgi:hypothetical protein